MPSDSSGEMYANTLLSQLKKDKLDEYATRNLVALITDGAANMVKLLIHKIFLEK